MSTELTRGQRRRMKKLAKFADRATEADRLYLERFPRRQHRIRLSHRTEFEQVEIIDSEPMTTLPGWRWFSRSKCRSGRSLWLSRRTCKGETDRPRPWRASARGGERRKRDDDVFPLWHWPRRSRGGDEHEDKTAVALKATVTTRPRRPDAMQTPNESARLLQSSASLKSRGRHAGRRRAPFCPAHKENCKCQRTKRKSNR